ncbi:unnamed protein product [Linum tenue]|uniref:Nuclear pore complex protein NUP1 n=1 Tax=Linum tenue TaxID=586396 RepID=A0AAV0M7X5_9ROSI|nr:unnamed protein product [Linum tenue]
MAAPVGRDREENQPYDDGGGYGKFRKRPFRRSQAATPYDRPSTAIRNSGLQTANTSGNGWFSKLVDPAQRLIASGAHRLFASLLRKRLPPPPPTQPPEPEAERFLKQKRLEAISKGKQVETVPMLSSKAPVYSQGEPSHMHDRPSSSVGGAVTDLESMLQQKKFTRNEIDRLTALLQSRVVDLPVENEKSELVPPNSFLLRDKEFPGTPVKDNGIGNHLTSTPHVLEQDVASPAELAKAYMGSRPSKVSPSMLNLTNQPWKDDSAPQVSQIFRSKGPTTPAIYRSSGKVGLIENGFMTPRSRGRSAIYSMARTPYARTQSIKTLKRRSSVLESDIGSASSIRRIRQKSNLMSAGALSVRGTRLKSDQEGHLALTSKTVTKDEPSKENGDHSIQNSGFPPVSSKSSDMASKILQQLDVLVSSREKSPAKLSPSMLRGQALRSLEKIDSSKFLETAQNSTLSNARNGSVLDAERSIPEKDKIEQNGPNTLDIDGGKLVASKIVEKPNSFDTGVVNAGINFSAHPAHKKKPGFRMSADEDFLDIDDDDSAGNTSTLWGTGDMKLISSSDENKAVEAAVVDKTPALLGENPLPSSTLSKKDTATHNGPTSVGTSNTFAFAAPSSTEAVKQAAVPSRSAAVSDDAAIEIFSSGGKTSLQTELNGATGKVSLFSSVSPLTAVNNGFSNKFGASSASQSVSSQRVLPVAALADPVAKQPDVDNDADTNKAGVSFNTSGTPLSSVLASSPAVGMFSFGSGLQNGTLPGSSTGLNISSSSLSAVLNGSIGTDISVNAVNSGSTGNSASEANPPLSSSVFKFGSPATSSSVSFASACGGIGRSKTETSYGSIAGVPFGDSKPAVASTGSGLFGVAPSIVAGSTTSSSPSNDISATSAKSTLVSSPFGGPSASAGSTLVGATAASGAVTSNGSLGDSTPTGKSPGSSIFGTATSANTGNSLFSAVAPSTTGSSFFSFSSKSTSPGPASEAQVLNNPGSTQVAATGFATSTQSTPSQFGSSMSSPFGLNSTTAPATAAAAGSSIFGSSSISNPFSSGTSFGATSSTPSSDPNKSVSSSASTSSPLFGSSWSTTPVFGSGSSSSASSSGFVFGALSSSGASTAGATAFGSSNNATSSSSPFSFSAPAANPAPTPTVFGNPTITPSFAFASTPSFGSTQPSVNNDQMGMEDSMAEDSVQANTPSIPLFGQQTTTPPSSGFIFGSAAPPTSGNPLFGSTAPPSAGNPLFGSTAAGTPQFGSTAPGTPQFGSAAASPGIPFQFGGQPSMSAAPQAASPFQASNSLECAGSFSLGTGDKSNRRIVKVRKSSRKK